MKSPSLSIIILSMTVRVYTSKHCAPCHDVDRRVKKGQIAEDVELIDIETEEGFLRFKEEVLDQGDGAVPSAYKGGQRCKIQIDEETDTLIFACPTDAPPSDQQG